MRKYLIALIIIVVAFNGLQNLRELNDLAIVKAMGIDITEDGTYKIYAIVSDTSEKESTDKGIIYEAGAESVQETVRLIVDKAPKKLYLAHMETLILSEKIAKEKFMETLDFFIRDNEGSNNFYLFIANQSDSKDIIKTINEEEINMKEMLISSTRYRGNSNTKTLNDNIKDMLRPGRDILVNSCKIVDGKIKIDDMAFFKDWSMIGFLSDDYSIVCNILNNNIENTIITEGENEDLVVSEIISCKTDMSLENEKDVKIKVEVKANISETGKNISIKTAQDTLKVQGILEEKIESYIVTFTDKLKTEYNADLIGIGNLLYRKKSPLFNEEDYLNKVNISVEAEVKIQNQGGVIKKW
ncbi:MAG: Ger(x)C family spore germination protein [Clostridia bacterium]|nr:Ger(x)C family spore germination protein [Clostridia bacterium]